MNRCRRRQSALAVFGALFLATLLISCGSASPAPSPPPPPPPAPLASTDLQQVFEDAAKSLNVPMVIAVAARAGKIFVVFPNTGAPETSPGHFGASVDHQ